MNRQNPTVFKPDRAAGLYRPEFEHDACGVGMVCDLHHRKSHALVRDALKILVNLTHRGACGCDETSGDGAGILVQQPRSFLEKAAERCRIALPPAGEYAAGLVFLPTEQASRRAIEAAVADAAQAKGLRFLGWRAVPVNPEAPGDLARKVMPVIRMAFVGAGDFAGRPEAFERQLFLTRKSAENRVRQMAGIQAGMFHIVSLSARTIVYKGMLLAMGFVGPEADTIVAQLGLDLDERGTIRTGPDYMTSKAGVFAAGDARRGQSLIVWAISEGREAARAADLYLMGRSDLPQKACCDLPRT